MLPVSERASIFSAWGVAQLPGFQREGEGMNRIVFVSAIALAVAGCATRPENIQPAYVTTVTYQTWTCQQLGEEDARLNAAYATAAVAQNHARSNDTVGVLLLGLPVASLSGENIAPQIASLKGQQDAVHQTEILKNCGSLH